MAKKKDFFIHKNEIPFITDEDYTPMKLCVQILEAFSRTTNISFYVIDYFKKNFLYVSENPLFLCGMTAERVQAMGYDFYLQQVTEEDLPLLPEIHQAGVMFSDSVPPESRLEYTLSCDFHMKQPSDVDMLVHHAVTPLNLTYDGKIWLALCMVSLSLQTKSGNIEISRQGCNLRWSYHPEDKKWVKYADIELLDYEKNLLRLSAQGYTMSEISKKIHKSVDTVKGYKRLLFKKLNAGNIAEAVSFAILHRLI